MNNFCECIGIAKSVYHSHILTWVHCCKLIYHLKLEFKLNDLVFMFKREFNLLLPTIFPSARCRIKIIILYTSQNRSKVIEFIYNKNFFFATTEASGNRPWLRWKLYSDGYCLIIHCIDSIGELSNILFDYFFPLLFELKFVRLTTIEELNYLNSFRSITIVRVLS